MIIAIDIDNTINNLAEVVVNQYNRDSGDNLSLNDITQYHIENFVREEYQKFFYKYFSMSAVWRQIKFIPECKDYIRKLFNDGHTIYFVTKTEPRNFYKKAGWIERNFPYIDTRKNFFNCPDKKLLNIDIMIDDHWDNLGGAQKYKILFDYPWNRKEVFPDNTYFRCYSWEEIYDTINLIGGKYGSSN